MMMIIIIIMSYCKHGFPGVSLAIRLYLPSFLAGVLDFILYPIAIVERFYLTVHHLHVHAKGVHRRTSLMQCPACLVRLIWMGFEMGDRWPYSFCFVGCCFHNLLHRILVQFSSSFFSIRLVSIHMGHPHRRIDATTDRKNSILFYLIGLTSIRSITYR